MQVTPCGSIKLFLRSDIPFQNSLGPGLKCFLGVQHLGRWPGLSVETTPPEISFCLGVEISAESPSVGCTFRQELRNFYRKLDGEGMTHVAWFGEWAALENLHQGSSKNALKAPLRDRKRACL